MDPYEREKIPESPRRRRLDVMRPLRQAAWWWLDDMQNKGMDGHDEEHGAVIWFFDASSRARWSVWVRDGLLLVDVAVLWIRSRLRRDWRAHVHTLSDADGRQRRLRRVERTFQSVRIR